MTIHSAICALGCATEWNGSGQYDHDQQREAVRMAQKALEQMRWLKPEERLPDYAKRVLVCREIKRGKFIVQEGSRDVGGWWKVYGTRVKHIVAWRPLPDPPEVST